MRTNSLANSGEKKQIEGLANFQEEAIREEEDGKETRVLTWVSEQDPSEGGKTGGNAQSQIFELPEDAETMKVKLRGVTILGSGGVMTGIVARLALPRVWREAEMEGR